MQKLVLAAVLAAVAAPIGVMAEVTGASVGFDYTGLAENGMGSVNKSELGGSLEYAINPAFSIQGDMAMRTLDGLDKNSQGVTLHAIARPGNGPALGIFAGKDWLEGKGTEFYGVEGAGQFGLIGYDAAVTHVDGHNADANGLSLRGTYAINDQLDLGGRLEGYRSQGETMSRYAATAGYVVSPGLKATGELGFADGVGAPAESYVGIGLKATFGSSNGTTFAKRGFMDFVPGY